MVHENSLGLHLIMDHWEIRSDWKEKKEVFVLQHSREGLVITGSLSCSWPSSANRGTTWKASLLWTSNAGRIFHTKDRQSFITRRFQLSPGVLVHGDVTEGKDWPPCSELRENTFSWCWWLQPCCANCSVHIIPALAKKSTSQLFHESLPSTSSNLL